MAARSSWTPLGCSRLGDGDFERFGISPKAALLDRAAAAGLAVPAGFVVPDGVDAPRIESQAHRDEHRYAVRSAFGAEDTGSSSLAGWFDSFLDVESSNVPHTVERVRASATRRDGDFRLDVLVMELVAARHAGVAFSEPGTYDDVVNVVDGLADQLVAGTVEGRRIEVPRLEVTDAGWPTRLRNLLADVRRTFGDEPWDIEWADDDTTCWLIQLRPITAPTIRNETLTAANHAEILPRLPSQLMTSVIEEAGPDLFAWYRRRVPGLPAERDFLHVVAGRPMINLSLLEDMMRHLGLPTTLVADSIGGGSDTDHGAAPLRVVRRSPSLLRLGAAQVAAVARAGRNRRQAASIGTERAQTFTKAVDDLRRSYVTLVTGMFPLSSAIGPPLSALRASGTLLEHASRHRTVTAEMAAQRQLVERAPDDEYDQQLARFLVDYGHRGVFESDVARPRYRDDPSTLAVTRRAEDHAESSSPAESPVTGPPPRTVKGRLTTPIWWTAAAPMRARELLRHDAMRSFAAIRNSLVALAGGAVERGQLHHVDDIWLLDADEARRLDDGWIPDSAFWSRRRRHRSELDELDVPHVVRRFDDPGDWSHAESGGHAGVARGLPLTTGRAEGRAWVLEEPADVLPDGFDAAATVLVARSVDAGWMSTLSMVAAVVVEIGGDLSHGSILIRELGLPAITNVGGATRRFATGEPIEIDAGSGTVKTPHTPEAVSNPVGGSNDTVGSDGRSA